MKRVFVIALVIVCGVIFSDSFAQIPEKAERPETQNEEIQLQQEKEHQEWQQKWGKKFLKKGKDVFFATDSANVICNNLGWAESLLTEAKISKTNMPSVFRSSDNDRFTIEMPCWEFDTNEFWAANVVVEHKRLDSALVKAKVQGVDDIYMRIAYDYGDYMRNAQFSCLCITKRKKKYIINATILIPKKKFLISWEISPDLKNQLYEWLNELDNLEQTEKAETPVEQE